MQRLCCQTGEAVFLICLCFGSALSSLSPVLSPLPTIILSYNVIFPFLVVVSAVLKMLCCSALPVHLRSRNQRNPVFQSINKRVNFTTYCLA